MICIAERETPCDVADPASENAGAECKQTTAPAPFDDSRLAPADRARLHEKTLAIRGLLGCSARNVTEIGLGLNDVHELVGRFGFQPWLEANFSMTQQTASNYQRAAVCFEHIDCLDRFHLGALYALAAGTTPETARQAAIERAQQGETITRKIARQLIEEHGGPAATPRPDVVLKLVTGIDEFEAACLAGEVAPSDIERVQRRIAGLEVLLSSFTDGTTNRLVIPLPGAAENSDYQRVGISPTSAGGLSN